MWQIREIIDSIMGRFGGPGRQGLGATLKSHRYSLTISLVITLLGMLIYVYVNTNSTGRSALTFLENIEARSLDARFQFRGPRTPDPQIVIVAIDQKTIDTLSWPFPRFNYGRMLHTLTQDGAKVVGFDVDFPFPDRTSNAGGLARLEEEYRRVHGTATKEEFLQAIRNLQQQPDSDAQFAKAIGEAGNVVLGHIFFNNRAEIQHMDPEQVKAYDQILAYQAYPQVLKRAGDARYRMFLNADDEVAAEPNLKIFADAAKSYGAFNAEADNDGTYRSEPVIFHYNDPNRPTIEENFYPSLAVQVARLYLGAGPQETIAWFTENGPDVIELGSRKLHPSTAGKVLINFAGPSQTYPYYSFSDVADGKTAPGTFRGKIVLVGASATGIGDMRPTPFAKQSYPGVEIHANAIDNMLHENFLNRGISEEVTDLGVMLFCGLVMGLLFVLGRPLISSVLYVAAAIGLTIFVYHNFSAHGRWLSYVLPFSTLSLNYLGVVSYRVLFEEKEKRKVRGAFSHYVAPGFIAQILKDPTRLKLGGEETELTVMFSDIRGFTSISEKMTPTELVELLNEYLTAMTNVVFKNRGTLDKYIGDAVMAFWGRPFLDMIDHAGCACRAALAMTAKLRELNNNWINRGRPPLKIGIGLNTGAMIVGNMGSQSRFQYTVIGDHVNLGSRVEGLTKEYGAEIIMTETVYEYVAQDFVTRQLDLIRVKGKKKPVAIYELLGPVSEKEKYADLLRDFSRALESYKAGRWEEAYEAFHALAVRHPSDGPTQVFLERCNRFLKDAPVGAWDGVYTMTTK